MCLTRPNVVMLASRPTSSDLLLGGIDAAEIVSWLDGDGDRHIPV